MISISDTSLARLNHEERLINTTFSGVGGVPGRYVYRGDLAVKFAQTTEKEKRPPEIKAEQVLIAAQAGEPTLSFFACYLLSYEWLAQLVKVLDGLLAPGGKYFAFCSNIDLAQRYRVPFGDVTFYVLPLEESTVYNDLSELLKVDKDRSKKKDAAGKIDILADAVTKFKASYEAISFERGLELALPVKDPGENRPV